MFFESGGQGSAFHHSQASGNPVKIGDGCATVTGYELPWPLAHQAGKAGARSKPEVRISAPVVLVLVLQGVMAACLTRKRANFSVKEKDEASLARGCVPGLVECLHSPICGDEGFSFGGTETSLPSSPRWSLNR
jgi:hypothetical protein